MQVEDAQAREAPVQRLADAIAGPFVYTVMTLAAATFSFWYFSLTICSFLISSTVLLLT
jgi:cation transport ATPase